MTAHKKIVAGIGNSSNETASNNTMVFAHSGFGYAVLYLVVFVSIWLTVSIIYEWRAHPDTLSGVLTITFFGAFGAGWLWVIQWVRRQHSHTKTYIAENDAAQERVRLEAHILAMTENYILYKDHEGRFQFNGTVLVTENRHFPAQIEAPKQEMDATEAILTMFDSGSSGREIERWLKLQNKDKSKEEQVSYRQIAKVLDLYRKGWQERSKKVIDVAGEYPVDE